MIFDNISESDAIILQDTNKSDDSEIQLVHEHRGIQLQQMNETLQRENSKLRAQFDEALRVNNQVGELHKKIQSLTNEITDLKNQKEELAQRLEITSRANDELGIKYEDQKESLNEQRKQDQISLQAEIFRTQQQLQNVEEKNKKIIKGLENERDKLLVQEKTIHNLMQRVNEAAEHYFERKFRDIEEIINYLNQPPLRVQVTQDNFNVANSLTVKNQEIAEIEKQKQKVQQRLEKSYENNRKLADEILNLKKVHSNEILSYTDQIDELQMKLKQQFDEQSIKEDEYNHKVEILTNQLNSLAEEIKKYKIDSATNSKAASSIIFGLENLENANHRIADLEGQLDDANLKITNISQKLTEITSKYEIASKKLKESDDEKNEIKKLYNKASNDLNALKLIHQNSLTDIQTLRTALSTKEDPKTISTQKEKIKKLKFHVHELEKSIQEKENHISEQSLDFEEKLQTAENNTLTVKTENERLKYEINTLKEKLKNADNELCNSQTNAQFINDPIIGNNDYNYNPYPNPHIMQVQPAFLEPTYENYSSSVKSFPVNAQSSCKKLKHELQESLKNNESLQSERDELSRDLNKLNSSISTFLFGKQNATIDECFSGLQELFKSHSAMKYENEVISSGIKQIQTEFPIQTGDLCSSFNDICQQFRKQKVIIQKRKKQVSQLKKATQLMKQQFEKIDDDNKSKEKDIKALKSRLMELEKKHSKMESMIKSLKQQLANSEKNQQEQQNEYAEKIDSLTKSHKEAEHSFREQIGDLNTRIHNYTQKIEASNEEINKYKGRIRKQKASIVELRLKLDNCCGDFKERESVLNNAHSKEKEGLENTVNQLRTKLQDSRNDIEALSKQLEETQKKLNQAKTYVQNLKYEKQKFSKDIEEQREKLERDKQIAETDAKACTMKVETDYAIKINQLKEKWEKEKRRYFAFAVDQFRQFFNPIDKIDERAFREVITRVRDELIRLGASKATITKVC